MAALENLMTEKRSLETVSPSRLRKSPRFHSTPTASVLDNASSAVAPSSPEALTTANKVQRNSVSQSSTNADVPTAPNTSTISQPQESLRRSLVRGRDKDLNTNEVDENTEDDSQSESASQKVLTNAPQATHTRPPTDPADRSNQDGVANNFDATTAQPPSSTSNPPAPFGTYNRTAQECLAPSILSRRRNHLAPIPIANSSALFEIDKYLSNLPVPITVAQLLQCAPSQRKLLQNAIARVHKTSMDHSLQVDASQLSCPRILASVEGVNSEVLIDGGSSCNIISATFFKTLNGKPLIEDSRTIAVGDGSRSTVLGRVEGLLLQLADISMTFDAVVFDTTAYEVLLGLEWLHQTNAVTSWRGGEFRLEIKGQLVTLQTFTIAQLDDFLAFDKNSLVRRRHHSQPEHLLISLFSTPDAEENEEVGGTPIDNRLAPLLARYKHLFASSLDQLTTTTTAVHKILLQDPNQQPIAKRYYRLNGPEAVFVKEQLKLMVENGIVEPSRATPWCFPMILVRKKSGDYRMCVDYRALNAITKPDLFPFPVADHLLDAFHGAQLFSTLDLFSGYWQVPMDPNDMEKTTFTTPLGNFSFRVMPFGLRNAPATFQRLMSEILREHIGSFVMVYLDDIVVYSGHPEKHLAHLDTVLGIIAQHGLKLNEKKCIFMKPELEFLGFLIGSTGLRTCPSKITDLLRIAPPRNITQLRSFVSLCSFYRRFVKGFAKIIEPLLALTRNGVDFEWSQKQNEAFELIKNKLACPPVLAFPDATRPFTITTDASGVAVGAVLSQRSKEDNREHPIAFMSKTLNTSERKYAATHLEVLAVVKAVQQWSFYIRTKRTIVYTDSQAVHAILNKADASGKFARWQLALQEFELDIRYKPGRENVVADGLSRLSLAESLMIQVSPEIPEKYRNVAFFLTNATFPPSITDASARAKLKSWAKKFKIDPSTGALHYRANSTDSWARLIVEQKEKETLLRQYHEHLGHFDAPSIFRAMKKSVYWPRMHHDIAEWTTSCPECQSFAAVKVDRPPMKILTTSIFERWALDFVGPLPVTRSGHRYILVAVEYLTSFPLATPTATNDARTVAHFVLNEIVYTYGLPKEILTDQGREFKNSLMEELARLLQTKHKLTTPIIHNATEK